MDQPNSPARPRRHGATAPRPGTSLGHPSTQRCAVGAPGLSSMHLIANASQIDVAKWFLPFSSWFHTSYRSYPSIYICLNKCVLMYFGRFGSKSIIMSCNQDRYGTIKTDCSSTSQLHGHQAWHHRKSAPHSPPWQSKVTYETGKAGSVTHRIIPSNSKWLHVIPSYSMLFSQWNMDKRGTSCVTSDPSP